MRNYSIKLRLKEGTILEYIFVSALLTFFFSDAANKYLVYIGAEFTRISVYVRAFYEFIFFLLIIVFINKTRAQFLIMVLVWFSAFLAGQYIFSLRTDYTYNFIENINIFNKYLFVLITYYSVYRYQYFQEKYYRLLRILELIFITNAILVIAGTLFSIPLFSTFIKNQAYTYRFGYSGLIPVQNEATMFFFITICYFYYKFFVLNEVAGRWKFYCVLVSTLLLGTKGIYLFLLLLFAFHFFKNATQRQRALAGIAFSFFLAGIYFFLQTDYSEVLLGYYYSKADKDGVLYTLNSGRHTYLVTKMIDVLSAWTPLNYFIGGQDQTKYLLEMDILDLFLFFGFGGMIVIIVLYFKTLFRFSLKIPFLAFFVLCFFLIAFFAGHFFTSAVNALYLCLVTMYFYLNQHDLATDSIKKSDVE